MMETPQNLVLILLTPTGRSGSVALTTLVAVALTARFSEKYTSYLPCSLSPINCGGCSSRLTLITTKAVVFFPRPSLANTWNCG